MSDPAADPPIVTEQDLAGLNRRALLRIIEVVRRLTTVLFAVAALMALAWLWTVLRSQGVIRDAPDGESFGAFGFVGEDLNAKQRADLIANYIFLLGIATVLAGLALGIRLYCGVATLRAGGSLTGLEVGDSIEPELVELDAQT